MFSTALRPLAPLFFASALVGLVMPLAVAQQAKDSGDSKNVPLKKVVMFTSGVGYFEHRGEVSGNAKVEMKFSADDINDLLKSMVLEDTGGGRIATVTYGSRDPITKTLETFPINLTDNPTLGDILNQVRGERVQIDAPTAIAGTLLGVEKRRKEIGKDYGVIEVEFLNLLTSEGLRSISMDSISRIKLLNEQLDKEFNQALAVLATSHNNDKKSVTLDFTGDGKRPVRVGYIQETPVWKTSYRLVLDEKGKPFLQGWAIVENTTEEDWNNVQLTLVSGRPISYRMDLYEPLYVERPLEQLDLFASLRPQTYDQELPFQNNASLVVRPQRKALGRRSEAMGGGMASDEAASDAPAAAPAPAAPPADAYALGARLNFTGQAAQAQGGDVGELFEYAIDTPVTLARQKSAMLPIVNQSIEGEKIAIYNPAVQAKHPLNGLKLTNSTDLHLMQGPITVFDGSTYAGDAKIEDLAPGADRLISYALDLNTEVSPEAKGLPDEIVSIKLTKGMMQVTQKLARETSYTIKNSDDKTKKVLVEKPREQPWTLVAPKEPDETTRDRYRFAVEAKPGEATKLVVAEENVLSNALSLSNIDVQTIEIYLRQKQIAPAVREALQEVVRRKQALTELGVRRGQLAQQIAAIGEDQARVRDNMARLEKDSDLYRRYVQKFGEQEDSIEKMRTETEKLQTEEAAARKSLDEYLLGLNVA